MTDDGAVRRYAESATEGRGGIIGEITQGEEERERCYYVSIVVGSTAMRFVQLVQIRQSEIAGIEFDDVSFEIDGE